MAAPPGPFGHVPGLPVPAPAPAVVGNYIAAAMLTTMNTIAQHLTAQAGAREENHLIGSLKIELIPHHLHEKIPKVCTWRLQLHVSFPPFWVIVASLKPAALTRADLWKDMEMPGEWILMFRNGIDMHYPTLDKAIKERVVARFLEVMTTYVSYVPQLQALHGAVPLNPNAIRALTDQMVTDMRPTLVQARNEFLAVETDQVTLEHGAKAGAMYAHITKTSFDGGMLGDKAAMKQVTYHSMVGRSNLKVVTTDGQLPGPKACRKCGMMVPHGGFKDHNKPGVCTGKGVRKKGIPKK